jgi:hypothetical protein
VNELKELKNKQWTMVCDDEIFNELD